MVELAELVEKRKVYEALSCTFFPSFCDPNFCSSCPTDLIICDGNNIIINHH